jgi:hypothetical protein
MMIPRRNTLRAAHLDPAIFVAHELEQRPKRRLLHAGGGIDPPHVIDHIRDRQLPDHLAQRLDIRSIEMQHHMPAESFDALEHTAKHVLVGRAAEMADEIEAHATHAAVMEICQLRLAKHFVHVATARRIGRNGIDHGGIVAAMAACLDDDGALDAKMGMEGRQRLLGCILGV